MIIKVKALECNLCEDVIWSQHKYDFKQCKCGTVAITGERVSFKENSDYNLITIDVKDK